MCQGLLEESDEEDKDGEPGRAQDRGPEAGDQNGGAEAPATPARLAAVDKKTEQQRRREKAARMLVSPVGSGLLSLLPQPAFFFLQPAFCHPCHLLLYALWNLQVACQLTFPAPSRRRSGVRGYGGAHDSPAVLGLAWGWDAGAADEQTCEEGRGKPWLGRNEQLPRCDVRGSGSRDWPWRGCGRGPGRRAVPVGPDGAG